jgi:uncharacterized membrane protein
MTKPSLATIGALIFGVAVLIESLSSDWSSPNYFTGVLVLIGAVVMFIGFRRAKATPKQPAKPMSALVFALCLLPAIVFMPLLAYYRGGQALSAILIEALLTVVVFFFCGVYLKKQGKLR